jgi:hypothetical protein
MSSRQRAPTLAKLTAAAGGRLSREQLKLRVAISHDITRNYLVSPQLAPNHLDVQLPSTFLV